MTLQEAFDNFILSRRLADLSPKSVKDYQDLVSPFLAFAGAGRDFATVSQGDINGYLASVLERPLSRSSRATYIRHFKIFLKWCENEYDASYVSRKIKVPRSPKKEVRIYTDSEVAMIFDAVKAEPGWLALRNRCIIALMYDSGIRQSEVCSIRHRGLSLSDRRMVVSGKGSKERTVPIGRLAAEYMQAYLDACPFRSDFLFVTRQGKPLSCNSVKLMVSRLAAALPFDLSSHKLRHNFATNYCIDQYETNGSIDIYRLMYLMGHEDVETTRRYLHFAYEILASRGCISHLDMIHYGKS